MKLNLAHGSNQLLNPRRSRHVVFRFNSAFPYGPSDWALWAGRALTSGIDLGFAFGAGAPVRDV